MPKKILILYTSVGLGHKSIAENIGFHLERAGHTVKLFDVFELQAGTLVSIGTTVHQFINRRLPFVWKWLYTSKRFTDATLSSRVKVAGKNYHKVKREVDEFQPDLVITTQTSASAIIQYLKNQGWYKNLFAIAFSDYHLHRYWLYEGADFYLANIEEQQQEMINLGIPADKIYVLGMTLKPRPAIDAPAVRAKLGLTEQDMVTLIASGSLGTGLSPTWFHQVVNQIKGKVIIVCGKNQELFQALQPLVGDRVKVFGYYSPMAELYAISDVFLTKPGGLTVAETLQWGLPLLITHWLPGQEDLNYHYLLKNRLILPVAETADIGPQVQQELTTHTFRESLFSNPARLQLIQLGHEGELLIQAVNRQFHKFDRSPTSQ